MPQIYYMDRRLYFPSEGRRAEDFFRPKNPKASAGFEPANLGTKGQHANIKFIIFIIKYMCRNIFLVKSHYYVFEPFPFSLHTNYKTQRLKAFVFK